LASLAQTLSFDSSLLYFTSTSLLLFFPVLSMNSFIIMNHVRLSNESFIHLIHCTQSNYNQLVNELF